MLKYQISGNEVAKTLYPRFHAICTCPDEWSDFCNSEHLE